MQWVGYAFLAILGIFCASLALLLWMKIRGSLIDTIGRRKLQKIRDDLRFIRVVGVPLEKEGVFNSLETWVGTNLSDIQGLKRSSVEAALLEAEEMGYLDEIERLTSAASERGPRGGIALTETVILPRFNLGTFASFRRVEHATRAYENRILRSLAREQEWPIRTEDSLEGTA